MKYVTLDFETFYDGAYSLSKMTTEAYVRDPRFQVIGFSYKIDDASPVWVSGEDGAIHMRLAALDLENSYVIAHNMAFDGAILNWHYNIKPKYYMDTLSMARPVVGTGSVSLAALAKKFGLGEKGQEVIAAMGKRREDFSPAELARYGEYCCNDVQLTWILFKILEQWNPGKELFIQDMMLRMFTDPVLQIDNTLLQQHLQEVVAKKSALLAEAQCSKEVLMSNDKFAELLQSLGVAPPMKISARTGKPAYAFSKTDLDFKALLEHEDIRVQAVVAARMGIKTTLEETRTQSFLGIAARGALPILLNYWGAHTGRASGGDKMNLQNLPRGGNLRKSIRAPAGHVLCAVDSSQIEARVVAWLAGQWDLVEDFRNRVDIYSKFATLVYGRPIDRKRKALRADGTEYNPDFVEGYVGKTCILGLGYGMGAEKFCRTLKVGQGGVSVDMPADQGAQVVAVYRRQYDRIAQLWKDADRALSAMVNGREAELGVGIVLRCTPEGVELPNGTMLKYPNLRKDEEGFLYDGRYGPVRLYGAKMIENVVQALARIVVFEQMAAIEMSMRKRDTPAARYRVVLTVHDEVVAVVPEHEGGWALDIMTKRMSTPLSWCKDLPIACEGAVAESYGDAK